MQYITTVFLIQWSAYKELKDVDGFFDKSKFDRFKSILNKTFNLDDTSKISGKVFNNLTKGAKAFGASIKATKNPIKAFNAGISAMSATAKTALGVFSAVTVAIAAIAIAENEYDKAHDNIDETIAKKDTIVENISEINSELEEVDNQIAELESRKLNITDSDDVSALNTQIELLKQRKELLEWKAKNEQKENEKEANNIIEGTKNDSTYSGASYMDKGFN